ncbi:MAG: glycosyltransferase [Deltaproteobacteria bacterium]|nr:MAG: glycosyltransferase [Deltaproteobacteria bacterium]
MQLEQAGAQPLRADALPQPAVSIVIPVFNESASIPRLHTRLHQVLQQLGRSFEVVYVDDGSTDRSLQELLVIQGGDPAVKVVTLARNAGQHAAVLAGFAHARGAVVVTLDADLQNPPEEIPRLLAEIDAGHDAVGTRREGRNDPFLRRAISAVVSRLASLAVGVPMTDCGSMLRAYQRPVVDEILRLAERALFIPALGAWLARRPTEISIRHEARLAGRSRYSPLRFMQLGFDLMTGFSLVPIQLVSLAGLGVSLLGIAFGAFLLIRRLILGPESEGLFTLFAILFVFVGILIFAVGLVGEYVGRIYAEVRRRPPYIVRAVYPADPEEPCASS